MEVAVTGGTGFIGVPLCKALVRKGHRVTVLTRSPKKAETVLPADIHFEEWEPGESGPWQAAVASAEVLINLAGANIGAARWTAARKQVIMESRIRATRALVEALDGSGTDRRRPLLISASGKDYYGPRGEEPVDEAASKGEGFLADTCARWEDEARRAEEKGARVALLRLGLVLGPGGSLEKMRLPFRFYLGGTLGNGRQWVSWIHRLDVVRIVLFLMERHRKNDGEPTGPVNATSPDPVTMRAFCQTLGRVLGRPVWLPAPGPLLRIALGEMADALLTGQRVVPRRLEEWGFSYQFPRLEAAMRDAVGL